GDEVRDENAEKAQQRHVERDRTERKLEDDEVECDRTDRRRDARREELLDRAGGQKAPRHLRHRPADDEAEGKRDRVKHRPTVRISAMSHYERRSMTYRMASASAARAGVSGSPRSAASASSAYCSPRRRAASIPPASVTRPMTS